jgi:hypothetical protein
MASSIKFLPIEDTPICGVNFQARNLQTDYSNYQILPVIISKECGH